jgi:hypothetical protein
LESIDDGAFLLCKSLSKVDLPDGLLNIGNGAFVLCKSLGEFRIPRSVVSIGCCLQGTPIYEDQSNWENGLFYVDGCLMDVDKSLSGEVYVCRGTRLIASYALCNNKKITAVHIPSTVEYIGEGLISGSTNVSQIVVEEGNERYSSGANSNMLVNTEDMKLIALCEDVEMPNDIKIIGNGVFAKHNLKSIVIPESVVGIENAAFYGCKQLEEITLPSGLTSIGGNAFSGCEKLESIALPASVRSIGYGCFSECKKLKSVSMPEGLTEIPYGAFYLCTSLKAIHLPESITRIEAFAFNRCRSLKTINIPSQVSRLEECTFYGCRSMKYLDIPENVTYIGELAFKKRKMNKYGEWSEDKGFVLFPLFYLTIVTRPYISL